MKRNDFIFVYGTLRRGERADLTKAAHEFGVEFVGEDKVNGEIYHLGGYPGAKVEPGNFDPGKPAITGEVFRITDDSAVVILDHYEGYPFLYDRVETETAEGFHVWIYIYNNPVKPEQRIASGDWRRQIIEPKQAA